MDSYQDIKTQIEKEENSVKDLENSLQDNNFTDSLYSPEQQDMKWNTEEENLVPTEHQYSLNDLYWCDDYDNVFRSEYKEQLSKREQLEISCPKEDN